MLICQIFRAIGFTVYGWLKIIDEDFAVDVTEGIWSIAYALWGCVYA